MAAQRLAASRVSFWTWAAAPMALSGGKSRPAGSMSGQHCGSMPPEKTEGIAILLFMNWPNCEPQKQAFHLAN
jgi:hypothetical protein